MVVMMMVVVWVEMIVLLEVVVVMKIQDVVAVLAGCGQLTNSGF